jgi:hypothetical protein
MGALISSYRNVLKVGGNVVGSDAVLRECARRLPRTLEGVAHDLDLAVTADWANQDSDIGAVSGDDKDVELEALAALREAAWASASESQPMGGGSTLGLAPPWTGSVLAAVRWALILASEAGVKYAGSAHLMIALLEDQNSRAYELIRRSDIGASEAARLIEQGGSLGSNARPWTPTADVLRIAGLAGDRAWPLRVAAAALRSGAFSKIPSGPVIYVLEDEANRQCVRLGHRRVALVHLVLAVASLGDQLVVAKTRLSPRLAPFNRAGSILGNSGAAYRSLLCESADLDNSDAQTSPRLPPTKRRGPDWTTDAVAATEQASVVAASFRHRKVGSDHLLAAILDKPDGDLRLLFQRCGVSLLEVKRQLEESLS